MSYNTYKGQSWIVTQADPDSKCQPGDGITIEGPPEKVVIQCNGSTPYPDGVYNPLTNMIESANNYEISKTPMLPLQPQKMFFTPKGSSRSTGGSWTAEDNIP